MDWDKHSVNGTNFDANVMKAAIDPNFKIVYRTGDMLLVNLSVYRDKLISELSIENAKDMLALHL